MQKMRVIIEAEIDEKTMQDCGCNTNDIHMKQTDLLLQQAYAAVIIHRTSF